ncbi:transglutaminase-like domain-containing protein [Rhodopseudomonas pseudopalustris]|uniref:Transglutaminase-like superfamily protein n=1 Tax=Rhodopseudomonas pseudopalustris TaxID=1513892 RepID=A0A1H8PBH0_9BRAD|nr:transglutaminase-like domain-containing protein [Rhodopseudomonas pseudopalustris]SEO39054.1 Transglutaminase-like superfamily protein [Rhodopseudomonas pseudopalustris]
MMDDNPTSQSERAVCLSPAEFVDSDHPEVKALAARATAGAATQGDRLRALYLAVRDGVRYDPYVDFRSAEVFRASSVLRAQRGYCVGKAAAFAALCRASEIPARVRFADVRNHLATENLTRTMGTDLFAWHGYTECWTGERWVKASPTFNLTLCEKLGVAPLDFDGRTDAVMQAFDTNNARFMEYIRDHGAYFDVPVKFLQAEMFAQYPHLAREDGLGGDMETEATQEAEGRGPRQSGR